jgi:hypothetical protein
MNMPALRDNAVFIGWIAGLCIAGSLLWSLTRPLQTQYLLRAVNKSLIAREDTRRLVRPEDRRPISTNPLGVWYTMIDPDSGMFVCAIAWDGALIPCGAELSPEGRVRELIPLSGSSEQLLDHIPRSIIAVYVRRIEAAAAERAREGR